MHLGSLFFFFGLDFRVISADLGAQCIWILHPLSTIQVSVFWGFFDAFFMCPLCASVCGGFYGACDLCLCSFRLGHHISAPYCLSLRGVTCISGYLCFSICIRECVSAILCHCLFLCP